MIITEKLYKLGLYIIIVCYVAISVLIESSAPSTFQYFTQTIGVGPGVFAIITALYFIIAACMQIPGGVVLDVFGFNKVVPISMVGTILGLILYWYARNEFVIELANIIWGVSLSIAYLIGIYIIPAFFSAARIPLLLAILGIGATLGNLSAYAPLTYLINRIGWNTTGAIFIGILILLLILFMLITAQMPNYK
ncbi:MAG: MFS transporter, partial [Burkholderiales bacterium]|nr:MFS transporter [Burkholderiales bacterium]